MGQQKYEIRRTLSRSDLEVQHSFVSSDRCSEWKADEPTLGMSLKRRNKSKQHEDRREQDVGKKEDALVLRHSLEFVVEGSNTILENDRFYVSKQVGGSGQQEEMAATHLVAVRRFLLSPFGKLFGSI